MSDSDIFTDKIKVAITYIEKRNMLSNQFHTVINHLNSGAIEIDRLQEYPPFLWACQNFAELYGSILRYTYTKVIKKEELKIIELIYMNYINKGGISLTELKKGFELCIKIMSLNNFDNVIRSKGGLLPLEKIQKRYKLE